jgi:hypothetical protein
MYPKIVGKKQSQAFPSVRLKKKKKKRCFAETHKEHFSRQQFGNAPVCRYIS